MANFATATRTSISAASAARNAAGEQVKTGIHGNWDYDKRMPRVVSRARKESTKRQLYCAIIDLRLAIARVKARK